MSTTAKVVLGILGAIVGLCVIGVGVSVFWLKRNGPQMMAQSRESATQGAQFGAGQPNEVCEPEALRRTDACATVMCAVGTQAFFRACLESSTPSPTFCAGVPPATEIMASARWGIARCESRGHSNDSRCNSLMNQVLEHCRALGH